MRILLDTYALIELFMGTEKGRTVKQLISGASAVYTTVLNLYELKYRLIQKQSPGAAQEAIDVLKTDTNILSIDESEALAASDFKLKYPKLGAVDCVTLACARGNGLTVVTGDADFPKAKDVILI